MHCAGAPAGNPNAVVTTIFQPSSVFKKIRSETPFTDMYIQPAAGDNGTALGAALHVWHQLGGTRRFQMRHGYWGPQFDDAAIAETIDARQRDIDVRQCTRSRIAISQV